MSNFQYIVPEVQGPRFKVQGWVQVASAVDLHSYAFEESALLGLWRNVYRPPSILPISLANAFASARHTASPNPSRSVMTSCVCNSSCDPRAIRTNLLY